MTKRLQTLGALLMMVLVGVAWTSESNRPTPVALNPTLTGQTEYCLTCHADLPEISPSHPIDSFGCVICHGGERLALDANLAHSSMRGGSNPSDLSVVEESCGGDNCHSGSPDEERDHIQRVTTSIQSSYTGAITNIRYSYGAQSELFPLFAISAVEDTTLPSATGILRLDRFNPAQESNVAVQTFGEKCLTCHLQAQPSEDAGYERFTGCSACHTPQFETNFVGSGSGNLSANGLHSLTTAIPYSQCNTCHNQGNYDLSTMTFVERSDLPTDRLHDYYQPIGEFTQCEYTLDCIDCHTRNEVMGNGDIYANQAVVQYIQCKTCHGTPTELPQTLTLNNPDDLAFRLASLNSLVDLQLGDTILVTEQGEPLWNTLVLADGSYQLVGRITHQMFSFRPVMGSGCTQDGSDQSSAYCHTCHAVER
jgi:hypothetical protein